MLMKVLVWATFCVVAFIFWYIVNSLVLRPILNYTFIEINKNILKKVFNKTKENIIKNDILSGIWFVVSLILMPFVIKIDKVITVYLLSGIAMSLIIIVPMSAFATLALPYIIIICHCIFPNDD